MNETTNAGRCYDGRITAGLKGIRYDLSDFARGWDESLVLTDADIYALLEVGQ